MLRRLALVSLATAAAGSTGIGPLPLSLFPAPDALTVTISESRNPAADGTYELTCDGRPGGNHPAREHACARLARLAERETDPFAPVPAGRICAQVYGGPALAHVTGTWLGHPVDARFSRVNGCEIARWENMEPVLPLVRV
ncbi:MULTISPECIES: SSI family serine proteinase inhibitor [unclassified Streptomyces]|uniref:SSI family serine proteinase inhibitor n=1 Tax=unclassified Streptomyces TaxID=2593676 RepID=UPI00166043DA|nr:MULTISPECIES: SSI family serine proteinase inhibitor [unclassified Streptomyces]MBD0709322.1 hypothetical protein [Streptomyces sp. CBMA291]MBD0712588.1 hypothetical protein [Streptomyces sp. CBMA370]